MYKTYFKPKN